MVLVLLHSSTHVCHVCISWRQLLWHNVSYCQNWFAFYERSRHTDMSFFFFKCRHTDILTQCVTELWIFQCVLLSWWIAHGNILNLCLYWNVNLFQAAQLQFRGQKIWEAAMEELLSKGMKKANQVYHVPFVAIINLQNPWMLINSFYQALLSGCSAGGLASIIHCDEFRTLFPTSTNVKCLSDAGFFLDA